MRLAFAVLLGFLSINVLAAQESRVSENAMIEKYLAAECDKLNKNFLEGARTIDEWKQKRPRLYQEYMDMLGLWPMPAKTPLLATITGTMEAHEVLVEKLHFQSKPGLYVTANLYRPKNVSKKLPAIVYVCGHYLRGRDGGKTACQEHGFWFANNGYLCIILDTLQLGEIPGVHHGTYGDPLRHLKAYGVQEKSKAENRFWWHCIGYSPAGVECWNGIRAIDYLYSRPEVDVQRIGVTGISGGGATTFWIAAADERVKVAVPVSGMSDLESYIKNKVINGHCDCMFLHNTYQWNWTTIAAMVAPRPLLFVNSDMDPIFPMDGNRRIITKLRTIYSLYGKAELVQDYVSPGGHDYRPDLRTTIFKFINRHLKEDSLSVVKDSVAYTPVPGRELRVFPDDRDIPKNQINTRADEMFLEANKVALPEKGHFPSWKKDYKEKLLATALRNLRAPIPAARLKLAKGWFEMETEDNIVSGYVGTNPYLKKHTLAVMGSQREEKILKERLAHEKNSGVLVLQRNLTWVKKSPPNYIERAHVLLGRTVAEGCIRDIISTARYFEETSRIIGVGETGILVAYAALLEPSIKEVVIVNPPRSHREGPYLLNVMRVLDIPEALGLLAPTPLTIVGGKDPIFDRTEAIYRAAGAEDRLIRE